VAPHPTWTDLIGFEAVTRPRQRPLDEPPTWIARLQARLLASRYDKALDSGTTPVGGTALAAHCRRLAGETERAGLAAGLRTAFADAEMASAQHIRRVPVRNTALLQAADVVADVLALLDDPRGVRVRGVARLRILLSDGRGPLYRADAGSLSAALRGVLAAL
jgi:hypothetical protein